MNTCNICTNHSNKWRICYKCSNHWCEKCNNNIMANGKYIEYAKRIFYNCPYCRNVFVKDSKIITPVTHKTSKLCIIM